MGGSSSKQTQSNLDELIAIEKATAYKAGVTNQNISNIKQGIQNKRNQNRKNNPTTMNKLKAEAKKAKNTTSSKFQSVKQSAKQKYQNFQTQRAEKKVPKQEDVDEQSENQSNGNQQPKITWKNKMKNLKNKTSKKVSDFSQSMKKKKSNQEVQSTNNQEQQANNVKGPNVNKTNQAGGRKRVSTKSSKGKKLNDKKPKRRTPAKRPTKKSTK